MAVPLGPADAVIMAVLFGLTIVKGVWVSWRVNRRRTTNEGEDVGVTAEDFFLAGRHMPFWAVGLSIFASNIGTEHFVGQAGAAATTGMPVSIYEWSAGLLIFFLGFGLAPKYLGMNLTTMPEWFERRFSSRCRLLLAVVSIVAYVLTKIAASLFAGAVLMEVMLGVSMWASVPVILAVTTAYAATGGLSAVMYTDVGQASVFVLGGLVGLCFALSEIGGVSGLTSTLERNGLAYFMTTLRPAHHLAHPWTGLLIGQPIASVWYWCVDQTIVQRVLGAKDIVHAQGGCALAGYLKILPPFLMVIPGMIARCFFEECQRTGGVDFPEWCETNLSDGQAANKAYPLLITKTFPDGLRGLMIVSMVLAMMSSLDSVFNCVSTIFTNDIYVRFLDRGASQSKQVWVGRLVTVIAAGCGMAWLPMVAGDAAGLYLATQSVMTHMSPALVAVFFLGLVWPRANGSGAFVGMLAGFGFGASRWVVNSQATCGEQDWASFSCTDFNHMALIIFALTLATTVVVSLVADWVPALLSQSEMARESMGSSCNAPENGQLAAAAAQPLHAQMLQVSGILLLAVMLVLCVGFGYTDNPTRGGHATISGGILSIACMGAFAAAANVGMLAVAVRKAWS